MLLATVLLLEMMDVTQCNYVDIFMWEFNDKLELLLLKYI